MLSFLLKQWSKYIYNFKTSWLKNRKSNPLENRKMGKENQEEETLMAENPRQWLPLPRGPDPQAAGWTWCWPLCGAVWVGLELRWGSVCVLYGEDVPPSSESMCPQGLSSSASTSTQCSCCVCRGHSWGSLRQWSGDGPNLQWFSWQDFPPEDSRKVIGIP